MTLSKRRYPGWSSQPEAGGQMPSEGPAATPEDYKRILEESYGKIAADIADLQTAILHAEDRNALLKIVGVDTAYTIPDGLWQSVVVSRPSYSEQFVAAFSNDVLLVFDEQYTVLVSNQGLTTSPFFGWNKVRAHPTFGNIPAGWSMEVIFTTRKYHAMPYAGF